MERALLKLQISLWHHDEELHLLEEFEGYEERYPREPNNMRVPDLIADSVDSR